ncbi:uncharacterized protein LOC130052719 isoform X2 [Ostrea edulis]|uniref:uncharacterized protein LOC130052719 isoform X2 n=1 Tax=Ostrea edulis TaxID=37623 RepID=UPI0024AF572A|nr:uncharacterized protein LOC130052719 isoform X2 [Ostrea edulis]XP_056014467.1 uncharacterized protein LOC130052719 isoform X2 [Ostrea edulis]
MKIVCLEILTLLGILFQGTGAIYLSLPDTATIVTSCPSSKEAWIERSKTKHCTSAFPSNISFVFHCVINEWGNATVEVCAVQRLILFGKCAEYNFGAKRIQSSGVKMCSMFPRPCPTVYYSTDAYMYPGCYQPLQMNSSSYGSQNVSESEAFSSHDSSQMNVITIIIPICIIIIIIPLSIMARMCLLKRLRHAPRNELSEYRGRFLDNEMDTETNGA